MPALLVDNDVLMKLAQFDLYECLMELLGSGVELIILGSARFVVGKCLRQSPEALDRFERIRRACREFEPDEAAQAKAADLVDAAQKAAAAVHGGEAILMFAATEAVPSRVVSGDKNAIVGAEALVGDVDWLSMLTGRLVCFEQVVLEIFAAGRCHGLRDKICASAHADRVMAVCFSCASGIDDAVQQGACLNSYIESLRGAAPTLLGVSVVPAT
jgi:hypothetical protein